MTSTTPLLSDSAHRSAEGVADVASNPIPFGRSRSITNYVNDEQAVLAHAAWIIEDALQGYCAADYPCGEDGTSLRKSTNKLHWARKAYGLAATTLVVLLPFQTPLWCRQSLYSWDLVHAHKHCQLPDGSAVELSGFPFLPSMPCVLVEAILILVATASLLFEKGLYDTATKKGYQDLRRPNAYPERFLFILAFMWLDLLLYVSLGPMQVRFSPYGRIALLFYWPRVRAVFSSAAECLDEFANIALFSLCTILFVAWLTVTVLDSLRRHGPYSTLEDVGGKAFGSLEHATQSFFEMSTGANYPDSMIPLLRKLRWTALIFYPFMVLTFFLFMQLTLAVVYNAYQQNIRSELTTFYFNRVKGLARAFNTVAIVSSHQGERVMTFDTFEKIVRQLRQFPRFQNQLTEHNARLIFDTIDVDEGGELTLDEFFMSCDYLQCGYRLTPRKSFVITRLGVECKPLEKFISKGKLDRCTNAVLAMNACFVFFESYLAQNNIPEPGWVEPLETLFSCVYVIEVLIRLSVVSFRSYWNSVTNRFDFILSWVLFFSGIGTMVFVSARGNIRAALPFLSILRISRLLRLLTRLDYFKAMARLIMHLMLVSLDMVLLLGITMLSFAALGVQCFGGLLFPTNPALRGSDYLSSGYDVLNFNDITGAMMSLFNMMVCNYMPEYADAMGRVSSFYIFGPLYCGAFFVLGVNIAFNIFVAFTIDVFVTLKGMQDKGTSFQDDERIQSMRKAVHKKDLELHVTMPSEVLKTRVVVEVIDDLQDVIDEAKAEEMNRATSKNTNESNDNGLNQTRRGAVVGPVSHFSSGLNQTPVMEVVVPCPAPDGTTEQKVVPTPAYEKVTECHDRPDFLVTRDRMKVHQMQALALEQKHLLDKRDLLLSTVEHLHEECLTLGVKVLQLLEEHQFRVQNLKGTQEWQESHGGNDSDASDGPLPSNSRLSPLLLQEGSDVFSTAGSQCDEPATALKADFCRLRSELSNLRLEMLELRGRAGELSAGSWDQSRIQQNSQLLEARSELTAECNLRSEKLVGRAKTQEHSELLEASSEMAAECSRLQHELCSLHFENPEIQATTHHTLSEFLMARSELTAECGRLLSNLHSEKLEGQLKSQENSELLEARSELSTECRRLLTNLRIEKMEGQAKTQEKSELLEARSELTAECSRLLSESCNLRSDLLEIQAKAQHHAASAELLEAQVEMYQKRQEVSGPSKLSSASSLGDTMPVEVKALQEELQWSRREIAELEASGTEAVQFAQSGLDAIEAKYQEESLACKAYLDTLQSAAFRTQLLKAQALDLSETKLAALHEQLARVEANGREESETHATKIQRLEVKLSETSMAEANGRTQSETHATKIQSLEVKLSEMAMSEANGRAESEMQATKIQLLEGKLSETHMPVKAILDDCAELRERLAKAEVDATSAKARIAMYQLERSQRAVEVEHLRERLEVALAHGDVAPGESSWPSDPNNSRIPDRSVNVSSVSGAPPKARAPGKRICFKADRHL